MKRAALLLLIVPLALVARPRAAQQPPLSSPPAATTAEKPDEGFPVASDLVKRKCSGCHHADDKGRLTRISYRRTTPEGWEQTLKRMVTLNNLKIEPAEAREIVRYLADHQGLAPEEAKPAAFEVERRQIDFQFADKNADKDKQLTEETCIACHSMGRVISQRRTKEEWELLVAMHRGYYWLSDFQAFRRTGPTRREPGADGRPPDNRHPMDVAITQLSTTFPLTTPEWAAWSATMRPPQLQGKWALSGYQPGKGAIFGQVAVSPSGAADSGEFTTEITYAIPATGEHVKRTGKAIVYTGFQWRGRSTSSSDAEHELREVMFIDRDWRHASGRWFTGAYDEFGIDVQLQRVGGDPVLSGVGQTMLREGGSGQQVSLFGANLPARATAADLNFGPGITVDRIVSAAPEQLVVAVSVAKDATAGRRSVFLNGATGNATIAVAGDIDYIKVTPQAGLARVGGANFPKQFQQFEAIAYANGPDGKPDTKDDIELGPVSASWATEEYTATFEDDDKDFVGTIDPKSGLFTPNLDGPNPKRKHNSNNYGDVWVVASFDAPPAASATTTAKRTIKARAHLLVTVPLYIKFDEAEVGR
jgi:quinohemoprotein amine dehydrogenase